MHNIQRVISYNANCDMFAYTQSFLLLLYTLSALTGTLLSQPPMRPFHALEFIHTLFRSESDSLMHCDEIVSFVEGDLEAILHVQGGGHLGGYLVAFHHLHVVAQKDGSRHHLHLHVGELLADAQPRAGVEHCVLELALRREHAVLYPPLRPELPAVFAPYRLHPRHGVYGIDDPRPLLQRRPVGEHVVLHGFLEVDGHGGVEPERLGDRRLEVVHSFELVDGEDDVVEVVYSVLPSLDGVGDLAQDALLDVGVFGQEPEEPGECNRAGVPPGQDEADAEVLEELVGELGLGAAAMVGLLGLGFYQPRQEVGPVEN